ncbi:Uncharacterised protein [Vibrio cholerae]|nr:Uncharacterised protein [Vibrio cholerae]
MAVMCSKPPKAIHELHDLVRSFVEHRWMSYRSFSMCCKEVCRSWGQGHMPLRTTSNIAP